jgi:drug/metabolite transporter (DMT)-like permease
MRPLRVFALTTLAMIAFAANSLLCRLALRGGAVDAASFTTLRIVSGALVLWIVLRMQARSMRPAGSWASAGALFAYAAAFSFAYLSLPAGTGALLLFGAVQATMIVWGWQRRGERLNARQASGLALALSGLVLLVLPGVSAPPLVGSFLMLTAGIAWGAYSLRGKGAGDATSATAGNFMRAVPMALALTVALLPMAHITSAGLFYAIVSGAITSGLGYVIWYAALPALRAASAASVQLSVPVLTAVAGILFLGESLTLRFVIAAVAVLGGIALVVLERRA